MDGGASGDGVAFGRQEKTFDCDEEKAREAMIFLGWDEENKGFLGLSFIWQGKDGRRRSWGGSLKQAWWWRKHEL